MAKPLQKGRKSYGASTRIVRLDKHFNWPGKKQEDPWWAELAEKARKYPSGNQTSWGIPFRMAEADGPRVILAGKSHDPVIIPLNATATHLCFLHEWHQVSSSLRRLDPTEGLVVAEYVLTYADGTRHVQPVRARFEVAMQESPGPPWLAVPFHMPDTADPVAPPQATPWGRLQMGLSRQGGVPLLYAMANPHPGKKVRSLTIRGLVESPLLVAGLTLYTGSAHPLAHLPRRTYRVNTGGKPAKVKEAQVDLGGVARVFPSAGPRGKEWVASDYAGATMAQEPTKGTEDLIEAFGARDAKLSVNLDGQKKPVDFSLGEAFEKGRNKTGRMSLEALGRRRQWMQVRVIDGSTGRPTPVRLHMSGARGEYIAPYGHHSQVNANWFEDYAADLLVSGRSYAYVPGEFPTDLPVGDIYVELYKGFEYEPTRTKARIKPGQKTLELRIARWRDLRSKGWVTADTHVHFISPHTAWLEAQAEGVNVVNLLASQWGRLFTNVGDYTGRVGIVEDDTIVYVGTENRNHMLGHMSMLGTKGMPVFPMCCGGPGESWVGDPDFVALAEWARENKRKGGVVIRPHFPYCGHTEDPVPILKGLVDALEIRIDRDQGFPVQEWYRYLNCGYRVAAVGGTDKMGAYCALGWLRTYAKLDTNKPFTYDAWGDSVRAGRTISTNGPLLDLTVEGREIGEAISMPTGGGTVEVHAAAEGFLPLGRLEVVCNGQVAAAADASKGAKKLTIRQKIRIGGSGWIAARCSGFAGHPGSYSAAHTSPVYIKCGRTRAFDGPAAEHMLALVEGGIEYLNTLATVFDERSRRRMVKLFNEARKELKGRLVVEAKHTHHHGDDPYHTHGHGVKQDHHH
ncbi:MAG: CehA/McbA family metallohydrolase [Planctomycetota bacterium]